MSRPAAPGAETRVRAARVVGRTLREGAWSGVAADQESGGLDPQDAAFLRAAAFGVMRHLERIDQILAEASARPLSEVDPAVHDLLRVAAWELTEARTPTHAAVHTAVEATRRAGRGRAAGFVNAVLRRLAGEAGRPRSRAGELAVPSWLLEITDQAWGEEESAAFWAASANDAPVGVRLRPGADPPPGAQPVPGIPGAVTVERPPVGEGWVIQDPASVAVGLGVGAQPGERVLDAAAAPGGKTLHLLDLTAPEGVVVAMDLHPRRVRAGARRVPAAHWVRGDAARPPFRAAGFQRVLLDAPCTGLGTLRRRPELRHKVTPSEVARLAALQRSMVAACLRLLAPGGRLVYSVCTVTPAETVEVVAGLGFRPPEGLPGRRWEDGWLLAPHLTGTDGMFIAVHDRNPGL